MNGIDDPIAQYSVPGVVDFLLTEWRKWERERASWEKERASFQGTLLSSSRMSRPMFCREKNRKARR